MFQSVNTMAQQQLNIMGYHLLLQEDQMKKEIPDTVSLRCECCLREEDVDLGDSNKNTTPYHCEGKARLGSIT